MEAEAYIGLRWRGFEERPDPRIDLWALSASANDRPAADDESVGRLLFKHEWQNSRKVISKMSAPGLMPGRNSAELDFIARESLSYWWTSTARWQTLKAGLINDMKESRRHHQRTNYGLYGDASDIAQLIHGTSATSVNGFSISNDLSGTTPVSYGTTNDRPEAETASDRASVANLLECFHRMPATEDTSDATGESEAASSWASTLDLLQPFESTQASEVANGATSEVETEQTRPATPRSNTPDSRSLES